jgi:ABC-type glycerol-3-phosphate transport system substrate-binding protein
MKAKSLVPFSAFALLFSLVGCAGKSETVTLTLDYALSGNDAFISTLRSHFSDISFEVTQYRGRNPQSMVIQKLEHADESDIVLAPSLPSFALQKERLLDLSGTALPTRYDAISWKDYATDGHIYLLPGPVSARFLSYNKTLFAEKGWSVPDSLDALVSLVKKIRSTSPEITPISLWGASEPAVESFYEALVQNDSAFSANGTAWLESFSAGTTSCESGLKNATDLLKKLVDAKAFSNADGVRWRSDAFTQFIQKRASAFLYVYNGQQDLDALLAKSSDEFGAIAIPGFHANNNLLPIESLASFGISKRLGEKGAEKKKEKALEVLDYLSSKEGMDAFSGSHNPLAYPLRGVKDTRLSSFFQNVYALGDGAVEARSIAPYFHDVSTLLATRLQQILFNDGSFTDFYSAIDEAHQNALNGLSTAFYGEFAEDFTKEQTAQFSADVLQSANFADISVVNLGEEKNGIINEMGASWGKIYKGKVDADEVAIPVPKDGGVLTTKLSGKLLKALLNKGRKIVSNPTTSAYFPFYFSGMEAEKKDGTIVSLKKEGTPIADETLYTLAYVGTGILNSSIKEIQQEFGLNEEPLTEVDTRNAILAIYSDYLVAQKGTPIAAPKTSN